MKRLEFRCDEFLVRRGYATIPSVRFEPSPEALRVQTLA